MVEQAETALRRQDSAPRPDAFCGESPALRALDDGGTSGYAASQRNHALEGSMAMRITPGDLPAQVGTLYPPPFDTPCRARERRRLGDAAGLTQFGINIVRLPPGSWSSQRHWHTKSDEFVFILEGEATLVTNDGPEILRPGEAAGFKAGEENGHCLQNRSDADVVYLEIGTRIADDGGAYSDIDMVFSLIGGAGYTRRDGTPYPKMERRGPR
jgi:uncharacterized cupin superfamily protein